MLTAGNLRDGRTAPNLFSLQLPRISGRAFELYSYITPIIEVSLGLSLSSGHLDLPDGIDSIVNGFAEKVGI